ncbi:MAG: type II secretion system protein GspK [Acidobacteriota bacterium]
MKQYGRQSEIIRRRRTPGIKPGGEGGVVLIALLWIFIALTAIALSFARESRVETVAVVNTQSLEKAYYVARAGVWETIYRLAHERFTTQTNRLGMSGEPTFLERGSFAGTFGDGRFQVSIQDESGKLDLNTATEDELRGLALAVGIPESDADIIADSVLDWRDTDSEHRMNGAEDEYYQSLATPYSAKNGRIDALEELLRIRGVTQDYFYGMPEKTADGSIVYKYGLSRCLTVYSNSSRTRINVNYAPMPVLLSIPGITQADAERIIEGRPFSNTSEISSAIAGSLSASSTQYLSTQLTDIFTLNVTAYAGNSKVKRVIRTVVRLDRGRRNYHQILYWNENVPDYEGTNL